MPGWARGETHKPKQLVSRVAAIVFVACVARAHGESNTMHVRVKFTQLKAESESYFNFPHVNFGFVLVLTLILVLERTVCKSRGTQQ